MLNGFQAIVLICLASTTAPDCNEANALVTQAVHVDNELGCNNGWQEIIARGGLRESLKDGAYLKTLCRREKDER